MQTGKITIAVAVITIFGGWGTALITNWNSLFDENKTGTRETQGRSLDEVKKNLKIKVKELSIAQKEIEKEKAKTDQQKELVRSKNKEIEDLKRPFHRISNSKLKQLFSFHNDAVCYGRSLNFTHNPDSSYSHCVPKEILAERFLKFFEELEIIESNSGTDYSRKKAKEELINLQTKYKFTNPGWYTEFMLGILIIEYAKKA